MCFGCVPGTVKRTGEKLCEVCDESSLQADIGRMAGILFGLILIVSFLIVGFCMHSRLQLKYEQEMAALAAQEAERHQIVPAEETVVDKRTQEFSTTDKPDEAATKEQPLNLNPAKKPSYIMARFFDTIDVTVQLKIVSSWPWHGAS